MNSDLTYTNDDNIQIGPEGAENFVRGFLELGSLSAPLFLITGQKSYESSSAEKYFSSFFSGRQVIRFSDFTPNPKVDELTIALDTFKVSGAKMIIAVGGGTAIDLAKLVNYFFSTEIRPEEFMQGKRGAGDNFIPLLAVPTTAGTGSETTHFSAIYFGFKKISISDKRMLPSHVWLNAVFTDSMSPYLTACTGFDALAQAIESYWAVGSTRESRQYSIKALKLCLQHIENAVLNPTLEHRTEMLKAAHFAGKSINVAKTTAAHAMSYALTTHYGVPHGHAVAMTLPALFEANADFTSKDVIDSRGVEHLHNIMTELCNLFAANSAKEVAQQLRDIMVKIGLSPYWLSEHDINPQKARETIIQEINEERLSNNPRRLNRDLLLKIVSSIH